MKHSFRLTCTQTIALGFLILILMGCGLLMLPIASNDGQSASFADALFTGTSAACVTGLIVRDTYTGWSFFGQAVILILIQIGGLGFMTVLALFSLILGRKIRLREQRLLVQSVGTVDRHGLRLLIRRVLTGTLLIETAGALLLSLRFIPLYGFGKGLWFSLFHAVSAFCNAGFDLMGIESPFSSMSLFSGDPLVIFTLSALILLGGLGFFVWNDLCEKGFRFKSYNLHTKVCLVFSLFLILIPTVLFFFLEKDHTLAGMGFGKRLLNAFFLSVSPRTAGFNSVDLAVLSDGGWALENLLMLVGGCPGSTAGGIKTTTLLVLLMGVFSTVRHKKQVTLFKRDLEDGSLQTAASVVTVYLSVCFVFYLAISFWEKFPGKDLLFHIISAVATVGLSVSPMTDYAEATRYMLAVLMYIGRIGGLSMALILAERQNSGSVRHPTGHILIG